MLRHYEFPVGGVWNYTRNLLDQFRSMKTDHELFLIYQNPNHVGDFQEADTLIEISAPFPTKFGWDHVAVPWVEKKIKLDLIFNPKYSAPLAAKCPTVFLCHGLDWYTMSRGSSRLDQLSHKYLVPRYARKAEGIIAVSQSAADDCCHYLEVPDSKLRVIYHGIGQKFIDGVSEEKAVEVTRAHALPKNFSLYVSDIYPAKDFARLVGAYARVGTSLRISLVVAGQHQYMSKQDIGLVDQLGISDWVKFVGWIEHEELPSFYYLAQALMLPSHYDGCPSPVLEAMSVGLPALTGNGTGMREMAGDAALLVKTTEIKPIAASIEKITSDEDLRKSLRIAGKKRASQFSWPSCAHDTLEYLEQCVN